MTETDPDPDADHPTYTLHIVYDGAPTDYSIETVEQVSAYDYEEHWLRMYHTESHSALETTVPIEKIQSVEVHVDE